MTVEQLNATPLYSKVGYEGQTAVILKIKDGQARIYDSSIGWISNYIPAESLTLIEAFTGIPAGTPASISVAPLYSSVTVEGTPGVIVQKTVTPNTFTGIDYWIAMIWFAGTETMQGYDDTQIAFTSGGVTPPPNGNETPGKSNLLLYAALAVGAYFLFFKKDKGPSA
jgi:hypothetical protein